MGEHKHNPSAILKKMAPPAQMGVSYEHVGLRGAFALKRNVLILPESRMQRDEHGAVVKVHVRKKHRDDKGNVTSVDAESQWYDRDPKTVIVTEGEQMGDEHLDFVVLMLGAQVTEGITDSRGRPVGKEAPITEIYREDARAYRARFSPQKPEPESLIEVKS